VPRRRATLGGVDGPRRTERLRRSGRLAGSRAGGRPPLGARGPRTAAWLGSIEARDRVALASPALAREFAKAAAGACPGGRHGTRGRKPGRWRAPARRLRGRLAPGGLGSIDCAGAGGGYWGRTAGPGPAGGFGGGGPGDRGHGGPAAGRGGGGRGRALEPGPAAGAGLAAGATGCGDGLIVYRWTSWGAGRANGGERPRGAEGTAASLRVRRWTSRGGPATNDGSGHEVRRGLPRHCASAVGHLGGPSH
jgi:hypothetical protein